jgi:hypothetical protein
MVRRLKEEKYEFYHEGARSIILNTGKVLKTIKSGELNGSMIVRCQINQQEDKTAYALAYKKNILAYFIVKPIDIDGFKGLQACRGWVAHKSPHLSYTHFQLNQEIDIRDVNVLALYVTKTSHERS